MTSFLEAWILTVGNEIINGVITDTNRETIARDLRTAGISVKGMSSVGDDHALIADALQSAMERARITVVSGGLGPTEDDKTAEAVARFLGVPMKLDQEQLSRIEERFRQWGRPMAQSNSKQALFPVGAVPIPNDYGTAPGFIIEKEGKVALFFPGVPREMIRMIRERGIPLMFERFEAPTQVFRTRTLNVYGLSESKLGEMLADVARDEENYHLAFLPRFPIIRLRMDVRAASIDEAEQILDHKHRVVEERLQENIVSFDGRSIETVILQLLEAKRWSFGLAESITGGMIGEMITRVPGASRTFLGSIVSYSNNMKVDVLSVSKQTIMTHGAVSHVAAIEMARGACRAAGSDVGLSVTGIAGPDGGTKDKPVGTFFVGLATPEAIMSRGYLLPGVREWVRTLAAMQALDLLRRHLLGYRLHGSEG
jgi:nicotinamide-nucleotide amidase